MAANHPCCNTTVTKFLRNWFKINDPKSWPEVYQNLKDAWRDSQVSDLQREVNWNRTDRVSSAFVWSETKQGHEYWARIAKRSYNW